MRNATGSTDPPGGTSTGSSPDHGAVVVGASTTMAVGRLSVSVDNVTALIRSGELVLDELSARERDVVLQFCELARRLADAAVTLVIDSAERTGSYGADGHASVRGWGRALCRWSKHDANTQVSLMRLTRDHPFTAAEYLAGRLGRTQAVLLAKLAQHRRAGTHYSGSEHLLVDDAQGFGYEDFRTLCNRWLTLADPDGADDDEAIKHYCRNGCVITSHNDMIHIDAQFASAQGVVIKQIFERFYRAETDADFDAVRAERHAAGDAMAVSKHDLPRTDEQRRADALHAIFVRAASSSPGAKRPEPVVNILVDHDTLCQLIARARARPGSGRSDGDHDGDGDPGDSNGGDGAADRVAASGWIDPATYRRRRCETNSGERIAPADVVAAAMVGHVRRVVIEGPSTIIDLGRRQRLFAGSARTAVQLQHPRCTYPGCGLSVELCQIDHIRPWRHHGTTMPRNGQVHCPRHNRWKDTGYDTVQDSDGHWHTTRPDGTTITPI